MNDDGRLTPEIKAVAIVVVVGAIMSILDTTIVNVALETLSRDLARPAVDDPVGLDRLPARAGRRSSRSPAGRPSASAPSASG